LKYVSSDLKKSAFAPTPARIRTISDILKNPYSHPNPHDIRSAPNRIKQKGLGYGEVIIHSDPIRFHLYLGMFYYYSGIGDEARGAAASNFSLLAWNDFLSSASFPRQNDI